MPAELQEHTIDIPIDRLNRTGKTLKRIDGVKTALAAAALLAVAVVVATPAQADTDDTVFLRALHNRELSSSGGDQELISLGHAICGMLADGYTMNGIASSGGLHTSKLSADDVRFIVQTSAAAYCPEYIR
jgi:Protein of unknown function (DUF732)